MSLLSVFVLLQNPLSRIAAAVSHSAQIQSGEIGGIIGFGMVQEKNWESKNFLVGRGFSLWQEGRDEGKRRREKLAKEASDRDKKRRKWESERITDTQAQTHKLLTWAVLLFLSISNLSSWSSDGNQMCCKRVRVGQACNPRMHPWSFLSKNKKSPE